MVLNTAIIPDRIEAGTFMTAAAITGGNVLVKGAVPEHLTSLIAKMEEMGVEIIEEAEGLRVIGPEKLKAVDIKTMPHPGFPTDMQSQMMALLLRAEGIGMITETVFENRFMHVEEFRRMNANIKIEGRSVITNGPSNLQGAEVAATDLRAAAALVVAGLVADGVTRVTELKHLRPRLCEFPWQISCTWSGYRTHQRRVSKRNNQIRCKCIINNIKTRSIEWVFYCGQKVQCAFLSVRIALIRHK